MAETTTLVIKSGDEVVATLNVSTDIKDQILKRIRAGEVTIEGDPANAIQVFNIIGVLKYRGKL